MHIYNTTFGVDPAVETEFIDWLRAEFIPESTADGEYFSTPELMRVVSSDPTVNSLALHMRARELDDIDKWYADNKVQTVTTASEAEGESNPYFSHFPAFGLPAEVTDCHVMTF